MAFKFVVFAALCTAFVQADSESPLARKLTSFVDKCKADLSSPPEAVALVRSKAVPTDEKQRCLLECVYKSMDIIKDNKFDANAAKALAKERFEGNQLSKAEHAIETCEKELVAVDSSAETCALGKIVRACFTKNADESLPNLLAP
uniref:Odorant-binding protein n=1 Tax=Cacopsylla melanoneura TaxID=428564 RepID=A0A8D8Z0J4_9HEMI